MARRRKKPPDRLCGVLVVDKPRGVTSFDVVRQVRRALKLNKVGHTGTLDPMATGVLALCLGEATRVAGLILAADKVYRGEGVLGQQTDTLDACGEVTAEADAGGVGRAALERVLAGWLGEHPQVPPQFSAIRREGKRAYELARQGETVELQARPVTLHRLELLDFASPRFTFEVHCSKGTYIRSLVRDWGLELGVGAHLSALRRLRSGPFDLQRAAPLDRLGELDRAGELPLYSVDEALGHLPALELTAEQIGRLYHGMPVDAEPLPGEGELVRVRFEGALLALGQSRGGRLWPKRQLDGAAMAAVH